MARRFKVEGLFYLCSENKDANQLRGYREADLRLCFRICKKPVFSERGSMCNNDLGKGCPLILLYVITSMLFVYLQTCIFHFGFDDGLLALIVPCLDYNLIMHLNSCFIWKQNKSEIY